MRRAENFLARLKSLRPSEFENLVFDTLVLMGLRNAVWRTPGSDEGRDIEGEVLNQDISGFLQKSKWYVECKRYSRTLDWPTVWKKMAYADVQDAETLLIVTTAHLTPQCKTQIQDWNSRRRYPAVRFWDAASLESIVSQHPYVLYKYSLAKDTRRIPPSFLPIARQTANVVQAAYGLSIVRNQANRAIEYSAALAELTIVRLKEAEEFKGVQHSPFSEGADRYDWVHISGNRQGLVKFDRYGLRAVFAMLRYLDQSQILDVKSEKGTLAIKLQKDLPESANAIIADLCTMANVEYRVAGNRFYVSPRRAS